MANGFQGKEDQQVPEMDDEVVIQISDRYVELYEQVVGEPFNRDQAKHNSEQHMQEVLNAALEKLP
jgi:phosphoribosylaminoimidazole-succinocarboxamide synthase